jgi:hypothetical protein
MKLFASGAKSASALAVATMLALGCSKPAPTVPTDFGVNVTVDAKALSASARKNVTVGLLVVSDAETQIKQFSVVPQITTGQLTFRYIPAAGTTGSLNFEFDALDGSGEIWGSGKAGPIKLVAGAAVPATITLAAAAGTSKGLGAKCSASTECGGGFCTDGVCCEGACTDTCASCALTNSVGLCTGYPAGSDPQGECAGSTTTGSGGSAGTGGANADGGSPDAEVINPPDGGIVATPASCGGTCNGMKACAAFAMAGSSCGDSFCNDRREIASPICDGKGTCGIGLSSCAGGYACDFSAKPSADCHSNCNANADCLNAFYCSGLNTCQPAKTDGLTCATDAECLHGHCAGAGAGVSGVCCNTACASPFTCNDSGSAGTCKCPGVATCAAGVSCTIFYPDADHDGYGDSSASLNSTTDPAVAGCAGTPPANHVADNTDCDDHDANVHPGQTAFFPTASNGTKTFDYDCDGVMEKGIPEYPGATCTFCPSACATNGCSAATSTNCGSANASASLDCAREGGICAILLQPVQTLAVTSAAFSPVIPPIKIQGACCGCAANDHAGFTTTVPCGVSSKTYTTCGTCGASSGGIGTSGGTATTTASVVQTCR